MLQLLLISRHSKIYLTLLYLSKRSVENGALKKGQRHWQIYGAWLKYSEMAVLEDKKNCLVIICVGEITASKQVKYFRKILSCCQQNLKSIQADCVSMPHRE
jgi:hypothetical protein